MFATGSTITKISVPELEVVFEEDAGHEIIAVDINNNCIFTTGTDKSLRLFDIDNGMMLIAPIEDMDCDQIMVWGSNFVVRVGNGLALLILTY